MVSLEDLGADARGRMVGSGGGGGNVGVCHLVVLFFFSLWVVDVSVCVLFSEDIVVVV